jgi:hypothetical protein
MARAEEVQAIDQLHQAAQARLGFAAAFVALAEWQAVSKLNPNDTGASWLTNSLLVIVAIRKMSRRLAVAHYQLVRALETGRTLGVPEGSPATTTSTTLGGLRRNFRDAAIDVAALPSPRTRSDDPDIRWFEEKLAATPPDVVPDAIHLDDVEVDPLIQRLLDQEGTNDSDPVTVDRYQWPDDWSRQEVDDAFRALLRKQIKDAADKVKDLRSSPDITPDEALSGIEEVHSVHGSIGSGTVDAAGINAGRDAVNRAIRSDRLVLAVARGTGPDPCSFCSMLASRGFVFKDDITAGVSDDVTRVFHTHCHCYPVYKFVKDSQLPPLSQYFKTQWPIVTRGYAGREARKAWRRWIYAQRKANPDAPHGAQSTIN